MSEHKVIDERVSIQHSRLPQTALMLLLPIEGIGITAFAAYMLFHFHDFVATSTAVINWLVWFGGLSLYVALGYLAVKVLRAGIDALVALAHGVADVHNKFIEARNTRARRQLLHTADGYVVYLLNGKITVEPVHQERYNYSIRQTEQHQELLPPVDEMDSLPAPVQTFRELLESGVIQKAISQGEMLLGYTVGTLRYGSWLDLYSCGVGGVSGSGKSTTVRFLLFQALLAGARLVMVDPHIEEPKESLAAQFKLFKNIHALPPCGENEKDVAKRITWLMKEYLRRKAKGIKGPPLVFVLDEFNAIVRRLPDELRKELADLLLTVAQEGRKFGVFAMIIAQRWSEQDLGGKNYGAAIRSSLASTLAHRFTDEDQAKKLIGGRNGARCLELEQGHYFFRDTRGGLSEMITPATYMEDGAYIQAILDSRSTPESTMKTRQEAYIPVLSPGKTEPLLIAGADPEITNIVSFQPHSPSESTLESTEMSTLARRVMRMQADGTHTKADIMRQVWGVNPGGSEEYKRAVSQYQEVMQYIAEQMGA